ncbi:MAG: ABC transporter ATP-binding protein [Wenzhouxiangellaceae bacterium]
MKLVVEDLRLGYGEVGVVDGLSFELESGRIGCLLGASGCGKTTVLRAIAGFEPVRAGRILIGGETVAAPGHSLPPEKRGIGMVFQDFALFPHLNVEENIAFGLRRMNPGRRRLRVQELIRLTGLHGLEQRYPHELSGGQQQRAALARALAPSPRVLLLDEPFSSLDAGLRRQMGEELRRMLIDQGTTALLVTHDQQEAFAMADRIGLMADGRLLQWASPYELYHRPACRHVAAFTGRGHYLRAEVADGHLEHALGRTPVPPGLDLAPGQKVEILVRPDDLRPADDGVRARVLSRQFLGAEILYGLALPDGQSVAALFPSHLDHPVGATVRIALDAPHVVLFEPGGNAAMTASV